MTEPHVGQEVDSFDFRIQLAKYGFSPEFVASRDIEILLDGVIIETLTLMRERGYIHEKYIFSSKGNGVIGIRDTTLADNPDDLDR
jgi:hypothetical protein